MTMADPALESTLIRDPGALVRALAAPATPFDAAVLPAVRAALARAADGITASMVRETGYTEGECRDLIDAARRFVDLLPELVGLHRALLAEENARYRALSPRAELAFAPWGRCLVCTPANAPAPLALALPLALAAAGNRVAVAFSGKAIDTGVALARIVAERVDGISLWGGRVRDAVEAVTTPRGADLVYFLGGSSYFPKLASACATAGVQLVYEGEGNSVALIHADARDRWPVVIEQLVAAKQGFGGRMCSAPNAIAVPRAQADELAATFRRVAAERATGPIDPWIAPPTRAYLDELVAKGEARLAGPLDGARGPQLAFCPSLARALERELFCPVSFLVPYDDWDACVAELANVPHRLQLSVFTAAAERARHLAQTTSFARYCVNMNPIAQDPVLPWGNYGVSGVADVLDFYRKGLRRTLIEWT